jgi:pyrimidine-nucleoside phosphorylase
MHVEELLLGMRSGQARPEAEIEAFVRGVCDGSVSRPQAAAWLAWAFARGLSPDETVALTRAMTRSGEVLRWGEGPVLTDKHSTGGVGDKVSLILGPLWAELGRRVPMVSGRGLGHTGGTLDKLEAIPGYRTDLGVGELRRVLDDVGCFISGQTAELAPADRVLYALRNEIQAVESIPLITGSILSKKLAEGVEHLVLDVKVGSGAFMKTLEAAQALARSLVDVARSYGVRCEALITAMDRPLGVMAGNALEVEESIACLQGGGPADLRALTLELAGDPRAAEVLNSGRAYERFVRMVEAQGGDLRGGLLGGGCTEEVVEASADGVVAQTDAWELGRAAFVLGAGRRRAEDPVDFGVGLKVHVKPGDRVVRGQPVVTIVHRDRALDEARALVNAGVVIGDEARALPLVVARVG